MSKRKKRETLKQHRLIRKREKTGKIVQRRKEERKRRESNMENKKLKGFIERKERNSEKD